MLLSELPELPTAPPIDRDELARRGRELYAQRIRALVETEDNLGKIVSIDVETGDYQIADDVLEAALPLHARRRNAALWSERIGYNAVYAFPPMELERTAK